MSNRLGLYTGIGAKLCFKNQMHGTKDIITH